MTSKWTKRSLAELCELFTDGDWVETKDQSPNGVRLIQTGNVGEGRFKDRKAKARFISSETFARRKCEEVLPGDCLVSRLPDPVGRACIIPETGETMITAVDCTIMRFKEPLISPQFFIYYSQSKKYLDEVESLCTGATRKRISRKNLGKVTIDLPLIWEQKRIVAILDEAFAGVDAAIANTKKSLANARELFESYLNSIFTVDIACSKRSFGDSSVLKIVDGDRGKNYPKKQDFSVQGHCLFLNTKNVRPDGFRFDSLMFISEDKDSALGKGKLRRRDVILTTRGTVGNVAIFDSSVRFDHVRINSGMLILRANEQVILADYLFELLRSPIVQSQINSLTTGAAQPQLPIKSLINFKIPIPDSLDMQREFVSRIREFQVEFRRLESIYMQKHNALTELKQSLLQKAFTGELTAENMDNEAKEAVI